MNSTNSVQGVPRLSPNDRWDWLEPTAAPPPASYPCDPKKDKQLG